MPNSASEINANAVADEKLEVGAIQESPDEESRTISGVLVYCKQRIVYPYLKLLGVMGLKPFQGDTETGTCKLAIFMNKLYILFVTLILLLGYALQYMTCFRRDRGFALRNDTDMASIPINSAASWNRICHGNSVYIHILPSVFHFSAYLYMVILYRLYDDEQLPNLIERVFLQGARSRTNVFVQRRPIRTIQLVVILSIIWIILSCSCQLIQVMTHNSVIQFFPKLSDDVKHALVLAMFISNSWQDVIQVTVIVSYCVHCYLLSTYLNLIHARVQQHSITLAEATKEIGEIGKILKYLNDELAPGIGPLLLLDASLAISSFVFLFNGGNPFNMRMHIWDYASLGLLTFLWLSLFISPITQTAKLTTSCKRIREIGHLVRLRPFGYHDTPLEELDSFLLFVSTLQLEVHILRIPISTSIFSFVIIVSLFAFSTWGLVSD